MAHHVVHERRSSWKRRQLKGFLYFLSLFIVVFGLMAYDNAVKFGTTPLIYGVLPVLVGVVMFLWLLVRDLRRWRRWLKF